jgi:type III secretion protein Q
MAFPPTDPFFFSPESMPSPHAVALQPLRLTRNEAQARTTIAQRAGGLPLRLGTSTWQARLHPVTTEPAAGWEAAYVVRLEWAGAAMALCLPAAAIEQALASVLDGATLPPVPSSLADAVLEAGVTHLLQDLQSLGRGTPQLLNWGPAQPSALQTLPPHACDLFLAAEDGVHAIAGSLHLDGLGLLLVAGLVGKRAPLPGPLNDALPLALYAELGNTRLCANEVASIGPGDVVLMDAFFARAERTLWLSPDGKHGVHVSWPAAADPATPARLTVIQPWTETMPESPDTPKADTATFDSVPMRLSFDLGELSLTMAQLRALQPGQTLELGHALAGAVRIRANGALVGEGDLVEIDGQIGVSVRHLFSR